MPYRTGQLRHEITIQQAVEVQDTAGQPIETWGTYEVRRALITPLTGRERFDSQQRWPEVDHKIVMRGDPETRAITPKMRVVLFDNLASPVTSKVFNILAVLDEDERGIWIELMARRESDW